MMQYTIFSDVLAQLPLPFVWLNMHYLSTFVLHMSAAIVVVTATVNSLCQALPSAGKSRVRTCGIVCLILGCMSMITVIRGAMAYDHIIKRGLSFASLIVNIISLSAIVFVYGVRTLKHDILFIYGCTLTPLFWFSVTLLPIVLMLVTVYIIRLSVLSGEFVFQIESVAIDGVICLPLLLIPVFQILRNVVSKNPHPLFAPEKSWGVERKLRKAREAFNPDKEAEYNTTKLKCDHYCLVNSIRYKREIFFQTMLYQSLIAKMEKSKKQSEKPHDD